VGELAAQHLLDCGLSQFAFVGLGQGQFTAQRMAGFRATLSAAGRDCRHVLLNPRELRRWLTRLPRPCGIFVAGDQLAARVVELAGELDRRVPEDFAVLGCDNETLWCATAPVPLSSVDLNGRRIGEVAAETLLQLRAGQPAPAAPIRVPPAGVVARASTELAFAADERLARALTVIRDRACEPLTVEALSGAVHVTQRTLERLFRRNLGRNIHAEILRVRLHWACQLLRETDEPVGQVAEAAGFRDYGRFTRIFRQHLRATPTGYRRQFRHGG
jgi:LacI family transcriptional regulator